MFFDVDGMDYGAYVIDPMAQMAVAKKGIVPIPPSRESDRAKRLDVLACRDCGAKVRIPGQRGCAEAVVGSRLALLHCSYRAPSFAVKCLRDPWGS